MAQVSGNRYQRVAGPPAVSSAPQSGYFFPASAGNRENGGVGWPQAGPTINKGNTMGVVRSVMLFVELVIAAIVLSMLCIAVA
jgi:hypothetical protein